MDTQMEQKAEGYGKRPLWQWVVIYLVIGGIVYTGIYYFFLAKKGGYNYNQPEQSQAQPTTQQVQNVITLTADGFSPITFTIKSGATVSWINKSGKTATVNSDPHPAHTAYPPLNLETFPDNGTLSLTFNKPGIYGYHNHLNPSEQGTITVE